MIERIFHAYLRFVEKTSTIQVQQVEHLLQPNVVLGFWHGDCPALFSLVQGITERAKKTITVIVTANSRGDVIEWLLRQRGGVAARMNDGFEMRQNMKELHEAVCSPVDIFACSLDGPSGPAYEPKKLSSYLAELSDRKLVCCHVAYSRALYLKMRWDNYAIPLPFTKIVYTFSDFGSITRERLRSYREWKGDIVTQCGQSRQL